MMSAMEYQRSMQKEDTRIKTIVEYRKENRPMLCLIDEIFKGTNSADRIVGATQVIRKLAGAG